MDSELKIICKYKLNYRFEIIKTNKEIGKRKYKIKIKNY